MDIEKVEPKTKGGKRPGSGRKAGTPNKATADIKALAQQHGPEAIATLFTLMRKADTSQAKIAAAKELLDRGYGKPVQAVDASVSGGLGLSINVNFS